MTALDGQSMIFRRGCQPRSIARLALIAAETLVGGAAAICGPLLIATDGLGMERTQLAETPFDSFLWPGLILGLAVGGSLLSAAWLEWRQRPLAEMASLGAGGVLLGWIAAETVMIDGGRGLQVVIALAALTIIALALRLRGLTG